MGRKSQLRYSEPSQSTAGYAYIDKAESATLKADAHEGGHTHGVEGHEEKRHKRATILDPPYGGALPAAERRKFHRSPLVAGFDGAARHALHEEVERDEDREGAPGSRLRQKCEQHSLVLRHGRKARRAAGEAQEVKVEQFEPDRTGGGLRTDEKHGDLRKVERDLELSTRLLRESMHEPDESQAEERDEEERTRRTRHVIARDTRVTPLMKAIQALAAERILGRRLATAATLATCQTIARQA
jgi:hypothetical protein